MSKSNSSFIQVRLVRKPEGDDKELIKPEPDELDNKLIKPEPNVTELIKPDAEDT
jgi:hypothetical protein